MQEDREIRTDYPEAGYSIKDHWITTMNTFGKNGIPFLFILDFDLQHPVVIPLGDITPDRFQFSFPSKGKVMLAASSQHEIHLKKDPVTFPVYQSGFDSVMKAIHDGDTYLLNLCYTTPVSGISSLKDVFDVAQAPYKLWWPGKFVVFSPESFVSMADGMIRTYPMKGTIDASIPGSEMTLLNDVKEQEEHATVVDLLRNDLSMVASQVTVERYRFVTTIHTRGKILLQTSSEISGVLPSDYQSHLGDIMNTLLPAGSVTGAPKKKTVELIKSIEPEPRGYYTGVFGIWDGRQLESAVMIRMIEQREDGFFYRSGGGITYRSTAASEYQEMIDKVYVPF
ncbi:MAG TPA: aminodeoxychorismate synthase component I [Saprospiraceae bacterium]|nr:aminodeoxychorismate synthase component I [Saprospiraceae bacterium]